MKLIALTFILAALLWVITPFCMIWALNTLGITHVPYTFTSWLAAWIFMILLKSDGMITVKKS